MVRGGNIRYHKAEDQTSQAIGYLCRLQHRPRTVGKQMPERMQVADAEAQRGRDAGAGMPSRGGLRTAQGRSWRMTRRTS